MLNLDLFHIRKLYWNMSTWLERHNYARPYITFMPIPIMGIHRLMQGLMNIVNEEQLQES